MPPATFMLALVLLATPLISEAQQTERVYRIGWLSVGSPSGAVDARRAFSEALAQLGYKEGRTLLVEDRFAEGSSDRLRDSAAKCAKSFTSSKREES